MCMTERTPRYGKISSAEPWAAGSLRSQRARAGSKYVDTTGQHISDYSHEAEGVGASCSARCWDLPMIVIVVIRSVASQKECADVARVRFPESQLHAKESAPSLQILIDVATRDSRLER